MSASRMGEKHHSALIKEKDVKMIKLLIHFGFRNTNISKYLNVSKSIINDIKNNGSWKNVFLTKKDIESFDETNYHLDKKSWLDKKSVLLIKYLLGLNIQKSIITEFSGVPYSTVKGIHSGKIYGKIRLEEKDIKFLRIQLTQKT